MAADTGHGSLSAQRTAGLTYRIPTPPRIVIPTPSLNDDSAPDTIVQPRQSAEFLGPIDPKTIFKRKTQLEWTYERRREAQMVLPYLYLGPMMVARDEAWLKKQGITGFLAIRQKGGFQTRLLDGLLKRADELEIGHDTVIIDSNQGLIKSFPQATVAILRQVKQRLATTGKLGKVLVFCESGNERSAAVVAAFLMDAYEDMDYIKAMQLCQTQRFCVNYDDSMKRLLQGYWDIVCARQAVGNDELDSTVETSARSEGTSPQPPRTKRARELDDYDDDGMEGVESNDAESFVGRQFTPFVDEPL